MNRNFITKGIRRAAALLVAALAAAAADAQVARMTGSWDTVDDKTGEKRGRVEIYRAADGMYYGRMTGAYARRPDGTYTLLTELPAPYDKVIGTDILRGLKEDGDQLKGYCHDPESGNTYYGKIRYDAATGKLTLRGSVDRWGLLGRSQTWVRSGK